MAVVRRITEAARRYDSRMLPADHLEGGAVRVVVIEALDGVTAERCDVVPSGERIPEFLQTDRNVAPALLAQQIDHVTIDPEHAIRARRTNTEQAPERG